MSEATRAETGQPSTDLLQASTGTLGQPAQTLRY